MVPTPCAPQSAPETAVADGLVQDTTLNAPAIAMAARSTVGKHFLILNLRYLQTLKIPLEIERKE